MAALCLILSLRITAVSSVNLNLDVSVTSRCDCCNSKGTQVRETDPGAVEVA